jgi:hypothetical protein
MIRFRWLLAVALPVCVLTGGCGSGTEDLVRRAADDFTAALAEGDTERACDMLTERAREDAECSSLDLPGGSVESVEVWGDAAQVRTSDDVLFLRDLTSGWRVSGAGCTAQADRPYKCEVGGP